MSGCGCRVEGPPSAEVQRQAALGHAGLAHQAALYQQALAAQPRIVYCALHGAAERLAELVAEFVGIHSGQTVEERHALWERAAAGARPMSEEVQVSTEVQGKSQGASREGFTLTRRAGRRVARLRRRRALTQMALAEKSGVNRVTIARLEMGKHPPNVETLAHLARALKVSVVDLLAPTARAKRSAAVEVAP